MKKFQLAMLIAAVLGLAWAGWVVSGTTFSWSGPSGQGSLQYTFLKLNSSTNDYLATDNTDVASTQNYEVVGSTGLYLLDVSQIDGNSVSNTVAAPGASKVGAIVTIVNDGASNTVEIVEGTTLDSGGNKELGPEDVLMLFGRSATAWSAIYHDN